MTPTEQYVRVRLLLFLAGARFKIGGLDAQAGLYCLCDQHVRFGHRSRTCPGGVERRWLNLTVGASSPVVSIKKHKNDNDDDDNNNNHHGKGKKNNDGDAGLSECTIIQPGGGGGCKTWIEMGVRENEKRQQVLRLCSRQKPGHKRQSVRWRQQDWQRRHKANRREAG